MIRRAILLVFLAFLVSGPAGPARATPSLDLGEVRELPVLHNGRKMPLDTYARYILLQISGRSTIGDRDAVTWLLDLMWDGGEPAESPLFLINHPEVPQALGLEPREDRRYPPPALLGTAERLAELAGQAVELEEDQRTPVEKELIRVFGTVSLYRQLEQSFTFAEPREEFAVQNPDIAALLDVPAEGAPLSFLDVYRKADRLQPAVRDLANKPQEDWSVPEQEAFRISSALFSLSRRHRAHGASVPAILPVAFHGDETWLAPWDTISMNLREQGLLNALGNWQTLRDAYRAGDQSRLDRAADNLMLFARSRLPDDRELNVLGLEVSQNQLRPFFWAKVAYFLAFLTGFAALAGGGKKWFVGVGIALVVLALIPHTGGMVARMVIMGRPPVTNLYATFVFVGWVCAVVALLIEAGQRNGLGVLGAGISGLVLLLISARFAVEGDTMGKVVAVLDSNFWLTTHVLTITTGYAGCFLAGLLGHLVLILAIAQPGHRERHRSLMKALYATIGFGLTFSFLGTMLGGVWADQSWGRFWGWDPKENGALLIVLWYAAILHARLGGMLRDVGVAACTALGIITVMLAWLGVNLLGVGLHSYGFTSGAAKGLLIYIVVQVVLVAALAPSAKRRLARA